MRRLLVTTVIAIASLAIIGTASAQTRLATVVGLSGTLTGDATFQGRWDQANYPDEKDSCISRVAKVEYRFALRGRGPLVELDFSYPAAIRPGIETIRGSAKVRVNVRASGSAEALSGQYNKFVNCLVQTPGMDFDDPEIVPLTGMSPSLCSFSPMPYVVRLQGKMLGSVEPMKASAEEGLLRCGWIPATGSLPSLMGGAEGNWAAKRVFFQSGAPGTTVAVTYRFALAEEGLDCPGSGGVITDVCTVKQAGTITVRYRLGS